MIDEKVKNSIEKNLKDVIDNKLEEKNISNDKIDDIVNKSVNKILLKSKINKTNKDLSKLIDDKAKNFIIKNLEDVIDNKLEGINIDDEIINKDVNKIKSKKKKERKINEKLKEDVKYLFNDFMMNQKIIDYELINVRMN